MSNKDNKEHGKPGADYDERSSYKYAHYTQYPRTKTMTFKWDKLAETNLSQALMNIYL